MTFGTTTLGDLDRAAAEADPKTLLAAILENNWADLLTGIMEHVARLETGLLAIQRAQAKLKAAGTFPAVPTEIWEDRTNATHGQKRYLRLGFPKGALPNGQRKLYIGCKPVNITKARQMAARRRQWETLEAERVRLDRFLRMTRGDLDRLAGSVRRYQIPDDLGLEGAAGKLPTGPKPLPAESAPEWVRPGGSGAEWNVDVGGRVLE